MAQEKAKTCEEYVLNQFYDLQELFTEVAKKKNELAMKWELVKRFIDKLTFKDEEIYYNGAYITDLDNAEELLELVKTIKGEENGKH